MSLTARAAAHPVVQATLEEAGWSEDYSFDPTEWARALREDGYSVVPPAVEVLAELGGLTINPPRSRHAVYGSGQFVMNPVYAATGESPRIKDREADLGLELCPVGDWSGVYILLVAEDGSVIAETPGQVLWVGTDWADALHRMIVADTRTEPIGT